LAFLATAPYLIACSKTGLYVWNLLLGRVVWSVSIRVKQLAIDPNATRFAIYSPSTPTSLILAWPLTYNQSIIVSTENRAKSGELDDLKRIHGYLLIWGVSNPKPLVSWYLCGGPAKGIAFLPPSPATQLKASRISPGIQASSALVYLNAIHEFIVLEEQLGPTNPATLPSSSTANAATTMTPLVPSPAETPSKKGKNKRKEKEKSSRAASAATARQDTEIFSPPSTSIATQLRDGFYKQMVFTINHPAAQLSFTHSFPFPLQNSKQLLEGPSVFRQMFGNPEALLTLPGQANAELKGDDMAVDGSEYWDDDEDAEVEVKPITGLPKVTTSGSLRNDGAAGASGASGLSNAQAQKRLKDLFDAPSHALPPTSSLFSGFVEALMKKLPTVQTSDSSTTPATKPNKPKSRPSGSKVRHSLP